MKVTCRDCGRLFSRRPVMKLLNGAVNTADSPITLLYTDPAGRTHYVCKGCHVPGDDDLRAQSRTTRGRGGDNHA